MDQRGSKNRSGNKKNLTLIVYLSGQFENRRPLTNQAHPRQVRWNLKIPSWKRRNIYKFTNYQFLDSMLILGVFFQQDVSSTPQDIWESPTFWMQHCHEIPPLPGAWESPGTHEPLDSPGPNILLRNRWAPNMTRNKATLLVWWFGTCGNGLTTKALQQFHRWILMTCCLVVDRQPICRKWND